MSIASETTILALVTIISLIAYVVLLAYAVVAYIFGARGYSQMAKNRGIKPHWLAWIPGANMWLAGSLADHYDRTVNGKDRKFRKVYIIVSIALASLIMIVSIVYSVYTFGQAIVNVGLEDIETLFILPMLIYIAAVFLLCIPVLVIEYIIYYKIMASCVGSKAKGLIVLVIFVPYALPFLIFGLRNKMEGLESKEAEALPEAE